MSKKIIIAFLTAVGLSACQTAPSASSPEAMLLGTWQCDDTMVDNEQGFIVDTKLQMVYADGVYNSTSITSFTPMGSEVTEVAEFSLDDNGTWFINDEGLLIEQTNENFSLESTTDNEFSVFMSEMMKAFISTLLEATDYTSTSEIEFADNNTLKITDISEIPEEFAELIGDEGPKVILNCSRI